ncbi:MULTISPECIES: polysaccharide lyase 8 family protein [unclassified Streptomyces]|uniref:polysaccharide lyase 8 family protein n=1 Tax=unclassified Streptomyces TaxID=2593676 RepID=UPI002E0FEF49|nr:MULTISPECIES: polysaccharide lyase 8 family protein [unclassified Streptomyces]WSR22671.1 polysaccharide lyase 8 family protein [Streptomyces sp. NBC_01205]
MTDVWSRRAFLSAAGGSALLLGAPAPPAGAAPTGAFPDAMRAVWRGLLLGGEVPAEAEPFRSRLADLGALAAGWRSAMAPAPGSLWPDLGYASDPEMMMQSYYRLRTMAEAHVRPGTGLTGDAALRSALLTGLDHLHADVYHAGQVRYGNWYCWQIGAPQALLDLCVMLYEELPAGRLADFCAAVDHFVPDSAVGSYTGTSTGANRVDLCRVLALRGVVGEDPAKLALSRDALAPVFPYVTAGDGLYLDGSFVQHTWVPYTGTYGAVLLGGLGLLFALLKDTPWQVTDPGKQIAFDAVERAWAPFLFNGLVMDTVSGRAVSRGLLLADPRQVQQDDHARGHAVLASIVLLAEGASSAERVRWRGLVKGWMARDYYSRPLADTTLSLSSLARLAQVEADVSVTALPEPVGHRLFASMDRATHRRPGWAASLSMASKRIAHYETGNGENLRGWHTGSGMLSWWGASYGNGQYSDAFWPTVDPYRLPGTTVSRKALADGAGGDWGASRPDAAWVGGTTDGEFASLGQHLRGLGSTLSARTSWFFLADTIVCLGAGICGSDGTVVETVIDNRNLGASGTHALTVGGAVQPTAQGWSAAFPSPGWAHLAGFGGYVMSGAGAFRALREARTGRWSDVNRGGSTTALTRRYLTLWYDHGTDPADAGYVHQLLPGATPAQTAARAAAAGWLTVFANSETAQGVSVPSLGFIGVNFWRAGSAGPLEATAPCSVTVRERSDGTATVCVSDPARELNSLTLVWNRPVAAVLSRPPTVVSEAAGARLRLGFGSLTTAAGAGQQVVVRLG